MANGTGVSNYVFPEDRQAAEDLTTQALYEYAMSQPRASTLNAYLGVNHGYEMNALAREIQQRRDVKKNQKQYLEHGKKWLSQERRRMSDAELLKAIKENPVFRRRLMTLQNPETFSDSFWSGL